MKFSRNQLWPGVRLGFHRLLPGGVVLWLFLTAASSTAQFRAARQEFPNFDTRTAAAQKAERTAQRQAALAHLASRAPEVAVDFDPLLDSPKFIRSRDGFLTGPGGQGGALPEGAPPGLAANDPYLAAKAFLNEHSELFGHGADILQGSRLKRDYVDAHNGLRTVAWEQQLDGIPVFQSVLLASITKRGELASIASLFVPDLAASADAGTPGRGNFEANPPVSAPKAIFLAGENVGAKLTLEDLVPAGGPTGDGDYLVYKTPQEALVRMVWLPLSRSSLRLAWEVMISNPASHERFQLVIDAQTGTPYLRHNLTFHFTDATYTVFDRDSPSPLWPTLQVIGNLQPPLTNRVTIVTPALDRVASPDGWIPDGANTTTGNNADAFVDRNGDEQPDQPRPQGNPTRVFTFPLDLTQDPTNYIDASTVQLFWRANWYHDRLYEFGFTEAAGNYQQNNFGRGGVGNDNVICFVQAGADVGQVDNSMFQSAPDGFHGRCYMFIFTGPKPARDGSMDSEVVLHELTHGTSWRLVGGGGMVLGSLQGDGMGEGWSDFYAMALLGQSGDDPDAAYAMGGYVTYQIGGTPFDQNYYYGIRRYPYCTDMQKNPLTFKDIDPTQISPHTGVPLSPIMPFDPRFADEVHNQGEVWCVTLREMQANLMKKYGGTNGISLSLQLITDGMKLTPAFPNFLQARDAILLADEIDNAGTNRLEIWTAFAKRGMGFSASSPDGATTIGVREAYDLPTLTGLKVQSAFVTGGNGNGIIDLNECNDLFIVVTNTGTLGATNVTLTLTTTNANVFLMRGASPYPDISPGTAGTNSISFKLGTSPNFLCGTPITLFLTAKSDAGRDLSVLTLPSGTNGPPFRFDNFFPIGIPDGSLVGTNSFLQVSNIPGVLQKVTLSMYVNHPFDVDLTFRLTGPDGTSVLLSDSNGGASANYGLACSPDSSRTTFDDDATISITAGRPPFLGSYRPQQALSAFIGKFGTNVNGLWRLTAIDGIQFGVGTLNCWSLNITSADCVDGGGQCPGVDLAILMVDAPDPATVGSNLVYNITVTNNGPNIARGAVVTHNLPGAMQFVSATASQGSASYAGGIVTATLGNLPIGGSATITVTVVPTLAGTFFSSANVASTDPELNPQNNSTTVSTLVVPPVCDLVVGLSGFPNPTIVGGSLTYTVSVTNQGPAEASGVVLSNSLPTSVLINSVNSSQGTVAVVGNVVLLNVGRLTKDASATATIAVTPQAYGIISAIATATAIQPDPYLANNTAIARITVGQASDLSIGMTARPNPVVLNSNLTYQITVTNLGPNIATNVVVSQTLPIGINISSISVSQGSYTLNGNSLLCNLGTVIVGATASVRVVGATTRVGTLSSSATVTSSQTDPNSANNTASASAQVAPPFINIVGAGTTLTAENFFPPDGSIESGETVTIQFRLQNIGNVANTNLVATLLATGGVTSPSGPQTYGILRPIGIPGGSPVSRPFTFTANGPPGGTVVATLQLRDAGSNLPPATFSFMLPQAFGFTNSQQIIIPSIGPATNYPSTINVGGVTGQVGKVTVTLYGLTHTYPHDVNALVVGPSGASVLVLSHAADVSSVSDVTLTFDDAADSALPGTGQMTTGTWKPSVYSPGPIFSNPAPAGPYSSLLSDFDGLNPNGTWSLYVLDDNSGDSGFIANGWSLAMESVVPVNQLADVGLSVIASPEPVLVGDVLTYAFTITNAGPATATGVYFSNALPAFVSFISASVSQGNWTTNGNVLLANFGTLTSGGSATLTAQVQPQVGCPSPLANSASVGAFESDIHSGNNHATVFSTVNLPVADVTVGLAATPDPVIVASNLSYTISVTNNGPGNALNVVVTDPLPPATAFVGASASQGSATVAGGVLTANLGNLAPGAVATVSLTLAPTVAGVLTNVASVTTSSNDTVPNNSAVALVSVNNPAAIIVPAGAVVVTESFSPPNGTIEPGETVTVSFGLANVGVLNTVNLTATLLPTGGVTSPTGPMAYGVITAGGAPVARQFGFTASGSPGGQIVATLQLQDGAKNLGSVGFSFNLPAITSLTATNRIIIPDHGTATPYPSSITVSGQTGIIGKVTVTLNGLTHSFPSDISVLLASPTNANVLLMSHNGAGFGVTNLTLTFDDAALTSLPSSSRMTSGTNLPSRSGPTVAFPAPAPLAPYGTTLNSLNGINPNGTWALYVLDDSIGDAGMIASGWTLNITSIQPVNPVTDVALSVSAVPSTIPLGASITYGFTITNSGPVTAPAVVLADTLPAGFMVLSSTSSQGSTQVSGNQFLFNLGNLNSGATATASLTVLPSLPGSFLNVASLSGGFTDLNPANNTVQSATAVIGITPPTLSATFSGGLLHLTVSGQPGNAYVIQASGNLSNWVPVNTNTAGTDGTFQYTDPASATLPTRFYRAQRQGP